MYVLGIETSCDDTAVAIVKDGHEVISSFITGQDDFHRKFGGVVPEIASRKHLEVIDYALVGCLEKGGMLLGDIDAIAATKGPGLMGSLLVGLNFGKALAYGTKKPFYGVDHLEAHMAAPFLEKKKPEYPMVGLVVSGGHTNLYLAKDYFDVELLGRTVDDAAGEAFDKIAKYLGMEYPGGKAIDELSQTGNPKAYDFPRPMINSGDLNFSYSGLKTAVLVVAKQFQEISIKEKADIVAGFQEAVVDLLVTKTEKAMDALDVKKLAVSGGVSANSRLRKLFLRKAQEKGWEIYFPSLAFCTDNGAMVAAAGYYHLVKGEMSDISIDSYAASPMVPKGRLSKKEKKSKIAQLLSKDGIKMKKTRDE